MNVASAKQELRRKMRDRRDLAMAEGGSRLNAAVTAALAGWHRYAEAGTVAAYLAFKNEPDLSALFSDAKKRFVVPRVDESLGRLTFHQLEVSTLVRHRYGQAEPNELAPEVPVEAIDLILVPGLAFDPYGGRLGYGKGFYDRLLPCLPGSSVKVGVTIEASLVPLVPRADHDVGVSHLVSELGVRPVLLGT